MKNFWNEKAEIFFFSISNCLYVLLLQKYEPTSLHFIFNLYIYDVNNEHVLRTRNLLLNVWSFFRFH